MKLSLRNTLMLLLLALPLPIAVAQAAELADGTEILLLDGAGASLIGHGIVDNGLVQLRLVRGTGNFVMIIAAGDGSVQQYRGLRLAGGGLRVVLDDGTRLDLDELLARFSTRLIRVFDDGEDDEGPIAGPVNPPAPSEPPPQPEPEPMPPAPTPPAPMPPVDPDPGDDDDDDDWDDDWDDDDDDDWDDDDDDDDDDEDDEDDDDD